MDRLERIHTIDQLLNSNRAVSTARLLAELRVSLSTLKRDLEYMKDRLNAPIVWDRDADGYRFDRSTALVGPTYELPGLWFNDSEVYALLTMQQLLKEVQPGLLGSHLQPLQTKLEAILAAMDVQSEEVGKRIRILAARQRKAPVEYFDVIATATMKRCRVQVEHFNRTKGERTMREISPQQLVYYRDNWYVDCWCHLRDAIRTFSVDAFSRAELLNTPAQEVPLEVLREMLSAGYGIFAGEPTAIAKIRVGEIRARWVKPTAWHASQNTSIDAAGNYLLEIPYSDDRELLSEILSLLPDVEVIEPPALRERLRAVLDQSLRSFSD